MVVNLVISKLNIILKLYIIKNTLKITILSHVNKFYKFIWR